MILMWRLLHQKDPKLAKPNPWTETHFDYIRCSLILLRSLGSEVKYNCLEEACKSIETISVTVTIVMRNVPVAAVSVVETIGSNIDHDRERP